MLRLLLVVLMLALTAHPLRPLNGIDVLERDGFAALHGRRVGLITNHTGRDRFGRSTIDLLRSARGVRLVALFSPEHGIRGTRDEKVASSVDERTGLPIYSLYGETRQPTDAMLAGIDTLVYDVQDVGTRFYTYISTMGLAMEAAAHHGIRFVVLDRVNPIDGVDVAGPLADRLSFTAWHALPVRHGMTVGELARLFNAERAMHCDLQVIPLEGWRREAWLDDTDLAWVNPSPNMRSLAAATLYPGIGLLEDTNLSVGRGTATPFEVLGAPWIRGENLARRLRIPGLRCEAIRFTPYASVYRGAACEGIRMTVTDRARFEPVRAGLEIAVQLRDQYPGNFEAGRLDVLLTNRAVLEACLNGASVATLERMWQGELAAFMRVRARYLLY